MSTNLSIWLGRTAYQIMPDRFFRSGGTPTHCNGRKLKDWTDRMPEWKPDYDGEYRNLYYYGGNLKGIEEKLAYLKDLGFDMLYITPINQSTAYHHYDVGNHMAIDPWLGTWDDFKSMCQKAKEMDILIVVDLVFNHTGINSIYFNNPQYQGWYKKNEDGTQVFWSGFKDMPECNTLFKGYQDEMTKVVEKYLENGASGIRFDLGENLPKEFLQAVTRVKEKYPSAIFIGEMWDIATDKYDPKIFDGQLDSIMNYPISDANLRWTRYGKFEHFTYNFNRVYGEYPINVQHLLLNNIATHDTPTTMTMLAGGKMNPNVFDKRIWDIETPWRKGNSFDTYKFREYEAEHDRLSEKDYVQAKRLTQIALAIMYIIPGIPCVYQGTEVAETGYKDPFNRKPYPWHNQDEEMKEFVRKLGKCRKNNVDILATANGREVRITENVLVLERWQCEKKIILAVNRTDQEQIVNLQTRYSKAKTVFTNNNSTLKVLAPYGIIIMREG